jgi:hypothetical protein
VLPMAKRDPVEQLLSDLNLVRTLPRGDPGVV